jgi:hypothetical protein
LNAGNPTIARGLALSKRGRFGYGGTPGMVNDGPDYTSDLSDPVNYGSGGSADQQFAQGGAPQSDPASQQDDQTIFRGPLNAPVAGRTDHLPVHVASGSYVIPADIVSAMGEGNTLVGYKVIEQMFPPRPPQGEEIPVPVIVAGGEYVCDPGQVAIAGQGDVDIGHQILDAFVQKYRALTIKTLSKLPKPKKD